MKFYIVLISLLFVACSPPMSNSLIIDNNPVIKLRTLQIRRFEQVSTVKLMQAVIKTLAILNFQITRVDKKLAIIEAIQLENNRILQINIVITSQFPHSYIRMIARYDQHMVNNPNFYQRFYDFLSQQIIHP